MSFKKLACIVAPLLITPAFLACSSDSSNGDGGAGAGTGGDGNGNGGNGSGAGGSGAGNNGSGGGNNGSGGGNNGSGGRIGPFEQVPGTDFYDCDAPEGNVPALELATVVGGFDRLILVTHAPNDTERLFAVDQKGSIYIVKGTTRNATAFLNIESKVTRSEDEQGLLGLAFHPNYAENGLFYVHYSAAASVADSDEGDTIIEEYSVSSDPDVADNTTGRRVLHVEQPDTNHNGGTIAFGQDGYLYIALGDGGAYNDLYENGQNLSTLLGKILRITPHASGDAAYTNPTDNLIQDEPTAAPEIWDWGLRNPYRVNFDGCTGDLFIGDVGQSSWEEVNIEPFGEGRRNYGWPIMEGKHCRGGGTCDRTGFTEPELEFAYTSGNSVVGGTVYRGSAIPGLRGAYFYGDIIGRIWSATPSGGTWTAVDRTDELNPGNVFSIQNGGDGEIYVSDFNTIRKLQPAQ